MARVLAGVRAHPDLVAIGVVVLVALAFRLSFAFRVAPFLSKDSQSYFLPAWDLVHGGEFQLGLRRTPGYPGFVALALVLFGDDLRGVVLAQHLLGVGTAAVTYVLGRLTFGRVAGIVAGLLVAFSAPLLVYEHYILTETLFGFALTAALTALVAAWQVRSPRLWLLAGLLAGLGALVRPVGQVILPLAILAAAIAPSRFANAEPAAWRRSVVNAGLVLLGFAVLLVPWTIRNQLTHNLASPSTFGRTLIARTAFYDRGFVFYEAEQPPSDPDADRAQARRIVQQGADRREPDGTIAQRLRQELGLDPVEVNALMRELAIEAILRQPIYFLEGSLRFGIRIFDGIEMRLREHESERRDVVWEARTRQLLPTGIVSEDDFREASRLLGWYQPARFAPIPLLLFLVGSIAALAVRGWRPALVPSIAVLAIVLASAALDGPQERYRNPTDPAINVLLAGGVVGLAALGRVVVRRIRVSRSAILGSSPHPRPAQAAGVPVARHLPGGEGV